MKVAVIAISVLASIPLAMLLRTRNPLRLPRRKRSKFVELKYLGNDNSD